MKKTGTKGFTFVVFIIVLAGLAYYVYLSNHASDQRNPAEKSEIETLLNYDFEEDYPKTVRETVKLHCRYLKCAYNNEFTEDELFTVNQQIRKLFDDELLEYNTQEKQLEGLQKDIQYYSDNKQKFVNYSIAEASQVEYNTEGDTEYAKIKVGIMLRVDSASVNGDEEYILRKDKEGKWKILGWQAVQNSTTEDEGDAE
ncbi:MAG: DUF6715 family protein [Lachnospiraceae bacterium]